MGTAVGATIRSARFADAAGIARVETAAWRDAYPTLLPDSYLVSGLRKRASWPRRLRGDTGNVLVADVAPAGVVAYATWGPMRGAACRAKGQLYELYVDTDHREQGIGRMLCVEVARRNRARGVTALAVEVLAGNSNRFFYEALGARVVARTHHAFAGQHLPSMIYCWDDLKTLIGDEPP